MKKLISLSLILLGVSFAHLDVHAQALTAPEVEGISDQLHHATGVIASIARLVHKFPSLGPIRKLKKYVGKLDAALAASLELAERAESAVAGNKEVNPILLEMLAQFEEVVPFYAAIEKFVNSPVFQKAAKLIGKKKTVLLLQKYVIKIEKTLHTVIGKLKEIDQK